jgi:hypothetical protein
VESHKLCVAGSTPAPATNTRGPPITAIEPVPSRLASLPRPGVRFNSIAGPVPFSPIFLRPAPQLFYSRYKKARIHWVFMLKKCLDIIYIMC